MKKVIRKWMKYIIFKSSKIMRSFRREIQNNNLSLDDALEQRIKIKDETDILKKSMKQQIKEKKRKKTTIS